MRALYRCETKNFGDPSIGLLLEVGLWSAAFARVGHVAVVGITEKVEIRVLPVWRLPYSDVCDILNTCDPSFHQIDYSTQWLFQLPLKVDFPQAVSYSHLRTCQSNLVRLGSNKLLKRLEQCIAHP